MTIHKPPYRLIPIPVAEHEWRFEESKRLCEATLEFNRILESMSGTGYVIALKGFISIYPNHIDALHHCASYLATSGLWLEGLAFSQTAVAFGIRAFPAEFKIGRDILDTGYVSNRPFLRAAQGLMLAQRTAGLIDDAIETGEMCIALDPGDRMGARLSVPIYFMEQGRDRQALALFERKDYAGTFQGVEYLHALALIRTGHLTQAESVLVYCLTYYPQVARYLINRRLPRPKSDGSFGVISGGEYEAWLYVGDFGALWRSNKEAMKMLRRMSKPLAAAGWVRYHN